METIRLDKLISVIVPIYGVEFYIEKCIKSLINQTYQNLEIILVNDGSKDKAPEICDKYAAIDKRIIVIHKENGGLVSARKAGLIEAKGKYIGYVDGDDWVEPGMYEDMLYYAVKYDADIVAAGHKEELNGKIIDVLYNQLPSGLYKGKMLEENLFPIMINTGKFSKFGIYSYLWNKLFKKEILFEEQMDVNNRIFMGEDAACSYPTLIKAKSVYISDSTHYRYIQRVDSMVKARKVNDQELERYNLLYNHLKSKFIASEFSETLLPQLDLYFLSLLTVRSNLNFKIDDTSSELFAFGEVEKNSRIVVCGAGTFGQHLVKMIYDSNQFKLTGWIDEFYSIYNVEGFDINSIESVKDLTYDYVLVAFINEEWADKIKNKLIGHGVQKNKILKVSHYVHYPIPTLLKHFGIQTGL